MRRVCLVASLAVVALVAAPAAARAEQPLRLVVWSGGLSADGGLRGIEIRPDGSGRILRASAKQRHEGKFSVATTFALGPTAMTTLRAAAGDALGAPTITTRSGAVGGGYTAAVIDLGGKRHAVVAVNEAPPQLTALLAALDGVLPPAAQAAAANSAPGAHVSNFVPDQPPVASCASGQPATEIERDLSLKQAAQSGVATFFSKGKFQGDSVGLKADWKRVKAPISVHINAEFIPPPGDPTDYGELIKMAVGSHLKGIKLKGGPESGTPINFDLNFYTRAPGAPPRDCFHEIQVSDIDREYSPIGPTPGGGVWGSSPYNVQGWTHEVGHLMGLDDSYHDVFVVKHGAKAGHVYPLPENGLNGAALDSALSKFALKPTDGYLRSDLNKGASPKDLMYAADPKTHTLTVNKEFRYLIEHADVVINDPGGTVLVNKRDGNGGAGPGDPLDHQQNLITAGGVVPIYNPDFTLRVRYHSEATVNGLVAYCIDLNREVPKKRTRFDVLGPAADLPDPAMQALARLMTVARTVPFTGGTQQGLQSAIWRITDSADPTDAAKSLLAAAGVSPDLDFAPLHFSDANARSPTTGAVTTVRRLPRLRLLRPGPAARPRLSGIAVVPAALPPGPARLAAITVVLSGAPARVTLTLQRRAGRRWLTVRRLGKPRLDVGSPTVTAALPRLHRGLYRVRATTGRRVANAQLRVR
jgi:hypothetical protein